jgi:hypothetical protein
MNYLFGWEIKDGNLGPEVGRIVIFENFFEKSNGPSRDHNDLLRALASKFHLPKDDVISNANRFYWKRDKRGLIISPVRKLDEDWVYSHKEFFVNLLKRNFN